MATNRKKAVGEVKFKIDPKRRNPPNKVFNTKVCLDPALHCWIKAIAAIHDIDVSSAMNQAIEFARDHAERISL